MTWSIDIPNAIALALTMALVMERAIRFVLGARYVTHDTLTAKLRPVTDDAYLLRDKIARTENDLKLLAKDVAGLPDYNKHNAVREEIGKLRESSARMEEQLKNVTGVLSDLRDEIKSRRNL